MSHCDVDPSRPLFVTVFDVEDRVFRATASIAAGLTVPCWDALLVAWLLMAPPFNQATDGPLQPIVSAHYAAASLFRHGVEPVDVKLLVAWLSFPGFAAASLQSVSKL